MADDGDARATADRLINELIWTDEKARHKRTHDVLSDSRAAKEVETLDHAGQAALISVALNRMGLLEEGPQTAVWGLPKTLTEEVFDLLTLLVVGLLSRRRKLPLGPTEVAGLLWWITTPRNGWSLGADPLPEVVSAVETHAAAGPLAGPVLEAMTRLVGYLKEQPAYLVNHYRKHIARLVALLAGGPVLNLEPGEAWSDAVLADLGALEPASRPVWDDLLTFCQTAEGARPKPKWLKEAGRKVEALGFPAFKARLVRWFPLVDRPRTRPFEAQNRYLPDQTNLILPAHVEMLKGLVWCGGLRADRDLARALSSLALSAYRKIPGRGPRLVTLGNACVTALGMMPGTDAVGALALLKVKVKFGTAQKEIDKALSAAADREGMPRDEIEEMGIPAYGLTEVGRRREDFGEYAAELVVDDGEAVLKWMKADGKALKSVPAAVKKDHSDDLKELQSATKDVARMLGAQRDRLDNLFLARKTWPYAIWRERYLDHPLVGTLARRLIWSFTTENRTVSGIGPDGHLIGRDGGPLEGLGQGTTVEPWHPIGRALDEVMAWRARLEEGGIRQPFKQAHREVYVLTDAERATRVYSNRFAAHILRQHQFHALCAARGWRNSLRLMVDDSYPPASRTLPGWDLRAEFWVEGVGDEYGRDTNEAGTFLHLSTDQVRFYPVAAETHYAHAGGGGYGPGGRQILTEPVPLEEIPPLVFSEVMRDVDLFVGVASLGNDPAWNDGGPNGRYVDYWRGYSFGDLSATAQTRKAVLQRVIPRLKIAERCAFEEKFLVVRGDLRTYKIHLGSGNILMEPNDEYLCIVPRSAGTARGEQVFLPFEGDNVLSVVLSKALMLADDTKITDTTITSQIRRGL